MSSHTTSFIVQNGKFIPYEDAMVHVMSPAIKYGISAFEGLRVYPGVSDGQIYIFRLQEHLDRLLNSMKLLRFDARFGTREIFDNLLELLRRNSVRSGAHIRISAYIDGKGEMQAPGPVSYVIAAHEMPRKANVEQGIRCQVSSWVRISDAAMPPRIKCSANYVNSRLARFQALQDGYNDAILLNEMGKVAEGTSTCIFHVKDGKIITPNVVSGILESITRDTVIILARELGFDCIQRSVDKTELYLANEIFLVGSAAEIVPVISVDGISIGTGAPGPMTRKLQDAYFSVVSGVNGDKRGWLTPVDVPQGTKALA
jgi:branched-chain amino acid aminotransferase